jgi:hypothetical protein
MIRQCDAIAADVEASELGIPNYAEQIKRPLLGSLEHRNLFRQLRESDLYRETRFLESRAVNWFAALLTWVAMRPLTACDDFLAGLRLNGIEIAYVVDHETHAAPKPTRIG